MRRFVSVSALLVALVLPSGITAQETQGASHQHPVQLALFFPVQLVPETDAIQGIRLSLLYGKNTDVTGFDWGLVSKTTHSFLGAQFGGVGIAQGTFKGLQANGLVNVSKGSFTGVQWGAFVNSLEQGRGGQLAGVNVAQNFRGLQIGLVNYAQSLNGVQLGFINIIKHGGEFPVMVVVNWGRHSFDSE